MKSTMNAKGSGGNNNPPNKTKVVAGSGPSTHPAAVASTTTSTAPRKGNNPSIVVSAYQIYEEYVREVIVSGGYLDAEQIYHALSPQLSLDKMEEFRNIRNLNKRVDNAIYAYWQSHEIRVYDSLEVSVTAALARWKKLTIAPKSFDELGLGDLLRCPKVIELFHFPPNITRAKLSKTTPVDALRTISQYLIEQRMFKYDPDVEFAIELIWKGFHFDGTAYISFQIDPKACFYACNNTRPAKAEFESIQKKLKTEYLQKKQEAFKQSFEQLKAKSEANNAADTKEIDVFIQQDNTQEHFDLKVIVISFAPFVDIFQQLCELMFGMDSKASGRDIDAVIFMESLMMKVEEDSDDLISFTSPTMCKLVMKIVTALMFQLTRKRDVSGQGVDAILSSLQSKYIADIPEEYVDDWMKWYEEFIPLLDDLQFDDDDKLNAIPTASLLKNVRDEMENILVELFTEKASSPFINSPAERLALGQMLVEEKIWKHDEPFKDTKCGVECPWCKADVGVNLAEHCAKCHPTKPHIIDAVLKCALYDKEQRVNIIKKGEYHDRLKVLCDTAKAKRVPVGNHHKMTCPWCTQPKSIGVHGFLSHCLETHPNINPEMVVAIDGCGPWAVETLERKILQLRGILDSTKERHGIIYGDLPSTVISVILFYRMWVVECKHSQDTTDFDAIFDMRVDVCGQDLSVPPDHSNPVPEILRILRTLEEDCKADLNLPALECHGKGSFLTLATSPSRTEKLISVLQPFLVSEKKEESAEEKHLVAVTELTEEEWERLSSTLQEQLSSLVLSLEANADISFAAALTYLHNTVKSQWQQATGKYISYLDHLPRLLEMHDDISMQFDQLFSCFQVGAALAITEEAVVEEETPTTGVLSRISEDEILRHLDVCKLIATSVLCSPLSISGYCGDGLSVQDQLCLQAAKAISGQLPSVALELVFVVVMDVLKDVYFEEHRGCYRVTNSSVTTLPQYVRLAPSRRERSDRKLCSNYVDFIAQPVTAGRPVLQTVGRQLAMDRVSSAVRALNSVPFGKGCQEWSMWREYFAYNVCDDGQFCSILEFLALLNDVKYFPSCSFIAVPGGDSSDCVRLPVELPDNRQLVVLWQQCNYELLAAYCISFQLPPSSYVEGESTDRRSLWTDAFGMNVRACLLELYESLGEHALRELLSTAVHICRVVHRTVDSSGMLQELMGSLIDIAKVNFSTMERCAWDACQDAECGRVYLASLAALYPEVFPVLYSYGTDFAHSRQESIALPTEEDNKSYAHANLAASGSVIKTNVEAAKDEGEVAGNDSAEDVVSGESSSIDDNATKAENDIAVDISECVEESRKREVMQLLQREFHYNAAGQRPSTESPEGRKLRNSLDLLAASLYSSDVHFVMEVLQNADDNTYLEDVTPTLKFELYPHALVVFNNERGFDQANINAICNVGGSTKKGRSGYIGQKGIGFKSVFAISDRPEIHSNGYHIMFDKEVSMLEPIWIEESASEKWPVTVDPTDETHYETCLRLMLNSSVKKSIHKLTQELEEIFDGKLILFLNKVHRMVFEDKLQQARITHDRFKANQHWTKISSLYHNVRLKSAADRDRPVETWWWTVRVELTRPPIRRMDNSIESTEIVIAFPFTNSSSASTACLALSFEEGLLPVYAYLPTLSPCFPFMIQADFVLATSRESILDNDWNRLLLNTVPSAFVGAIRELATWMSVVSSSSKSTDIAAISEHCPRLASLANNQNLLVTAKDILKLIPRRSKLAKQFYPMMDHISSELKTVPFLMNAAGNLVTAADVIYTGHLHFDPKMFIPHDVLFRTLNKHFLHESYYVQVDEELMDMLGIERFSTMHLMQCISSFVQLYSEEVSASEIDVELAGMRKPTDGKYLEVLSGLLLAWNEMNTNYSAVGTGAGKKVANSITQLVPSNVRLKQSTGSGGSSSVHKEGITALKSLPIWPLSTGRLVSLEKLTILVNSSQYDVMDRKQSGCLEVFQDDLLLLDTKLFAAADKVGQGQNRAVATAGSSEKTTAKRSDVLRSFLTSCFAPPSAVAVEVSGHNIATGGIQVLSAKVIVSTTILSAYRKWNAADNGASSPLTRQKAAAYLAFLYFCSDQVLPAAWNELKEAGIVVPVMSARDRNKLMWTYDGLVKMGGKENISAASQREVHLGVEFRESTTAVISESNSMSTALRQLKWTVLDPQTTAFAESLKNAKCHLSFSNLSNADIRGDFNMEVTSDWQKFLLQQVGVVDFFKIATPASLSNAVKKEKEEDSLDIPNDKELQEECSSSHIPSLMKLLKHLLRNGHVVSTNKLSNPTAAYYLPMFMPNRDEVIDPVAMNQLPNDMLLVSDDVYKSVLQLLPRILKQLEVWFSHRGYLKDPLCSTILEELNSLMWFPVEVHSTVLRLLEAMDTTAEPPSNPAKMFLLASPVNVFRETVVRGVCKYPLGPHVIYCANKINLDEKNLTFVKRFFPLRDAKKSDDDPPLHFLVSYWKWLASEDIQNTTIVSNVHFMKWMYKSLFAGLNNKQDAKNLEGVIFSLLADTNTVSSSTNSVDISKLCVIWIPNEPPMLPDKDEDRNSFYEGRMFALSHVVKDDRGDFLSIEGPVKNLSKYYFDQCSDVVSLFARKKYCDSCKVNEGMFGVRGRVARNTATHTNPCRCIDKGSFGQVFPALPGLVYESPNITQLLIHLQYHRDKMLSSSSSLAGKHSKQFYSILNSISSNIWKSFNIKMALHPYSTGHLQELIDVLRVEDLIPVVRAEGSHFVTSVMPAGKYFLAVDDPAVYDTFKPIFAKHAETIIFVDAGISAEDDIKGVASIVQSFFNAERLDGLQSVAYDLEVLKADCEALLNLQPFQFTEHTRFISPFTFFAPKHLLSLWKLLDIPALSEWTTVEVKREVRSLVKLHERSVSVQLAEMLNGLLELTLCFLLRHVERIKQQSTPSAVDGLLMFLDTDRLMQTPRMQRLLNAKLYNCLLLQRKLTLQLGKESFDGVLEDVVQFALKTVEQPEGYEVFLHDNITSEELQEVAVGMILQVLRTEIALLTTNQQYELFHNLEQILRKFAKVSSAADFSTFLKFEGLQGNVQRFNVTAWTLADPLTEQVEEIKVEVAPSPPVDEEVEVVKQAVVEEEEEEEDTEEEKARREAAFLAYKQSTEDAKEHSRKVRKEKELLQQQKKQSELVATAIVTKESNHSEASPAVNKGGLVQQAQDSESKRLAQKTLQRLNVTDDTEIIQPEDVVEVHDNEEDPAAFVIVEYQHEGKSSNLKKNKEPTSTALDANIVERVYLTEPGSSNISQQERQNQEDRSAAVFVGTEQHPNNQPQPHLQPLQPLPPHSRQVVKYHWKAKSGSPPFTTDDERRDGQSSFDDGSAYLRDGTSSTNPIKDYLPGQGGKGRWHENLLAQNPPTNNASLYSADISQEVIQCVLDKVINADEAYQQQLANHQNVEDQQIFPDIGSLRSGRIGELLAVSCLRSKYPLDVDISWQNEAHEAGLPYDIVLSDRAGRRTFVEVKTHSSSTSMAFNKTWKISSAEVHFAHQRGADYFCMLISLRFNARLGEVDISQVMTVGEDGGLARCLQEDRASLLLRVAEDKLAVSDKAEE